MHGLGVLRQSADTSQNAVSIDLASASDAAQEIRDEVSATYGGALAEERLPRERGLVLWPGRWNFWNDGSIAAGIIRTMVEKGLLVRLTRESSHGSNHGRSHWSYPSDLPQSHSRLCRSTKNLMLGSPAPSLLTCPHNEDMETKRTPSTRKRPSSAVVSHK